MIIDQSDTCNFADDNTLYLCGKIQFMILGDKSHHKHVLRINSIKVEAGGDVLLLGITIDKKLTFK